MYINLGLNDPVEIKEIISITRCIFCNKSLSEKKEVLSSKLLPCLHAACEVCVEDCLRKGNGKCSSCSLSFTRAELRENKVLFEIVSDVDIPKLSSKLCSIHNVVVSNWCQDCCDFICDSCVKVHAQLKSTIAHSIVSKDNHFVPLLASTPKTAFLCNVHSKNEQTIFCHTCEIMTCRDCQLENHKDHKYSFIFEEVDKAKVEVFNCLKIIECGSLVLSGALKKCEEKHRQLEDLKVKLVRDIRKEFDKIRSVLKKRERELMESAVSKANAKIEECETYQGTLAKNLALLTHCLEFVKCVLYTSSDPVVFYTKDLMLNFMKNLNLKNKIPSSYDTINLNFEARNATEIKNRISECGTFHEKCSSTTFKSLDRKSLYADVRRESTARNELFEFFEPRKAARDSVSKETSSDCSVNGNEVILVEDESTVATDSSAKKKPAKYFKKKLLANALSDNYATNDLSSNRAQLTNNHIADSQPTNRAQLMKKQITDNLLTNKVQHTKNHIAESLPSNHAQLTNSHIADSQLTNRAQLTNSHIADSQPTNRAQFTNSHIADSQPTNRVQFTNNYIADSQPTNIVQLTNSHIADSLPTNTAQLANKHNSDSQPTKKVQNTYSRRTANFKSSSTEKQISSQASPFRNPNQWLAVKKNLQKAPIVNSVSRLMVEKLFHGEKDQQARAHVSNSWHIPENIQLVQGTVAAELSLHGNTRRADNVDYQSVLDSCIEAELSREPISEGNILPWNQQLSNSPLGVTNEGWCSVCLWSGGLVFCNNCPKGFHPSCHIPAIRSPIPTGWRCILCEELTPLPPATYHFFKPEERKVADRLLLEMFCQVEASQPFRNSIQTTETSSPCLSLIDIKTNLAQGKYVSILKFIADIRTLLVNCFRYRQHEPDVVVHGKTLEEIFNRLLSKFIPHLNSSSL